MSATYSGKKPYIGIYFHSKETVETTHKYFQIVTSLIHDNQKTQECTNVFGQVFESIYLLCSVFFFFLFFKELFA